MHKKKIESSSSLTTQFGNFKKHYPAEVSLAEFVKWCGANVSVVAPLLMLQLKLRKQIIGERYWNRMAAERKASPEQGQHGFMKKLQTQIRAKNEAFKLSRLEIEREQQRKDRWVGDVFLYFSAVALRCCI
jgi:hypothetical protein